ncbi:MAG: hypothetical protein AAB629_01360 [Patescibacteria group bacterium]
MQPEQSGVKTWQWIVTVIVIIVLIIIGIFVFGNKKAEAPVTGEETTTPATQTANNIIMSNQFPGNVVYISSVQAANTGWVAIQKDNAGQPGVVIGSANVIVGTNPVKVTLNQPTIDGGAYYAVMYSDDGDGEFDITKDSPLKDANGNVIMRPFRASATANAEIKG